MAGGAWSPDFVLLLCSFVGRRSSPPSFSGRRPKWPPYNLNPRHDLVAGNNFESDHATALLRYMSGTGLLRTCVATGISSLRNTSLFPLPRHAYETTPLVFDCYRFPAGVTSAAQRLR